jgi:L-ascorbate metabolism protein UlaG (beta-lactamase superfamily)
MPEQGRLDLTWLGHSTNLIELDGTAFLTDPLLRSRLLHLTRHPDVPDLHRDRFPDCVLISHHHLDHLDKGSLRMLDRNIRVIGPVGTGKALLRLGFRMVEELRAGAETEIGEVKIRAVTAEHDGNRTPFHRSGEAVGFVIEGSRSVYFAGDTDLFEGMTEEVGSTDLALLPVWGWGPAVGPGHLDPERAARAIAMLRPEVAVPIHWGTFFPLGMKRFAGHHLIVPPREFERLAAAYAPDTEVRVLEPGSSTSLP